jgi:hypothetical protein
MGKTRVFGFATGEEVFDLSFEIKLRTVADVTEAARPSASDFGFLHRRDDPIRKI